MVTRLFAGTLAFVYIESERLVYHRSITFSIALANRRPGHSLCFRLWCKALLASIIRVELNKHRICPPDLLRLVDFDPVHLNTGGREHVDPGSTTAPTVKHTNQPLTILRSVLPHDIHCAISYKFLIFLQPSFSTLSRQPYTN